MSMEATKFARLLSERAQLLGMQLMGEGYTTAQASLITYLLHRSTHYASLQHPNEKLREEYLAVLDLINKMSDSADTKLDAQVHSATVSAGGDA